MKKQEHPVTPGGSDSICSSISTSNLFHVENTFDSAPIQIYVRCPMANDRLVLIELDKENFNLETLEIEISRVTGVPLKLIRSEGLYMGHGKRKRIFSLSQLLEREEGAPVCARIVVIHLGFAAGLVGGKGGFGSLLRSLAKNTKTTNFGSCRDLKGRRMRHVNQEEELKRWHEEKRERKNIDRERQREYLSIKNKGRFMERRMCTFGSDCRYQWKCRYRHPGDKEWEQQQVDAAERVKVVQGPLTGFFGVANKPLKGVVGVSNVKKIRSDIMEGLNKQRSGKTHRFKRPRSVNRKKVTTTPTTYLENETIPQFKKQRVSPIKETSSQDKESSSDEFDDLDLGIDIRGSLPACATARIRGRPLNPQSYSQETGKVVGSYLPSEEHVTISIDADFKETAKRLKRERRRKQREAERRKRRKSGEQIVGGWKMPSESTSPKAPDTNVAASDMFLDDLFQNGENNSGIAKGPVVRTMVEDPDQIDLDDILCGDQVNNRAPRTEIPTSGNKTTADDNEINLDDLL